MQQMDNRLLQTKLEQLFPDADKCGRVKSVLLGLSDRELDLIFSCDNEAVKATLEHRLASTAAGAAGAAASAGAEGLGLSGLGLLSWLEKNPIDVSSLQAFHQGIDSAPISQDSKQFFKKCTFEVPDPEGKCILGSSFAGEEAVIRTDIIQLLEQLADSYSVVVLAGARRTGKSVGFLHSLLSARQKVLQKADSLVVLVSGQDLPVPDIKTILCISMYCGLPMVLLVDDMADIRGGIARGIKTFVEDFAFQRCPRPPLSVLVLGSEMAAIHDAGAKLGGLKGWRVSSVTLMPAPSLSLVLTMLTHKKTMDYVVTDEFAAQVLNAITMSGPNLAQHWSAEEPPSAADLLEFFAAITFLPAELSHIITRINDHGSAIEQDAEAVLTLVEFGYIRPRVVAGKFKLHMYDYNDYRLITYQELRKLPKGSDVSVGVEAAEGRVLEEVVRTEEGSILVVELLGLMEAWKDKRLLIYYGQAGSSGSEVDLLIVEKVAVTDGEQPRCNLYLCSVKRSESQQDLSCFLQHITWLYKFSDELQQQLAGAQQLTFVAISCIPNENGVAHVKSQLPAHCALPLAAPPQQQPREGSAAGAGGSKQGMSSTRSVTAAATYQDEGSSKSSSGSSKKTDVVAVAQHRDGSSSVADVGQQQQVEQQGGNNHQTAAVVMVPVKGIRRILFKDMLAIVPHMPIAQVAFLGLGGATTAQ